MQIVAKTFEIYFLTKIFSNFDSFFVGGSNHVLFTEFRWKCCLNWILKTGILESEVLNLRLIFPHV